MSVLAPPPRRDAVHVGRCVLRVAERRQIAPLEALLRTALREIQLPPGIPPWAVLHLQRLDLGAIDLRLPRARILALLRQRVSRLLGSLQRIDHADAPDAPAVWYGDRGPVLARLAARAAAGEALPWYAPQVHPSLPALLLTPATALPALLAELRERVAAPILRRLIAAWRQHPALREHVPAAFPEAAAPAAVSVRADELRASAQAGPEQSDPPLAARHPRQWEAEAPKPGRAPAQAAARRNPAPGSPEAGSEAAAGMPMAAADDAAELAEPHPAGAGAPLEPPPAALPSAPDATTSAAASAPSAPAARPDGPAATPTTGTPAAPIASAATVPPPTAVTATSGERSDSAAPPLASGPEAVPGFGRLTRLGGLAYAINALRRLGLDSGWQDLPPEQPQLRWSQVLRGLLALSADPEREPWLAWLDELAAMARADGAVAEAALPIPPAWLPELDPPTLAGGFAAACRRVVDRVVQRDAGLDLPRLLHRPALLRWGDRHLDVSFPVDQAELALRISGLDHDPGWCPSLGWVLRFHFVPWPDAPEPGPP